MLIVCRYEESIERIVELESRGDGSVGKMTALETELRRTKDKLAECQVKTLIHSFVLEN